VITSTTVLPPYGYIQFQPRAFTGGNSLTRVRGWTGA
jgi:hypothetical protein